MNMKDYPKRLNKLKLKEENKTEDFVKNPIVIKNNNNYEIISERVLQKLNIRRY